MWLNLILGLVFSLVRFFLTPRPKNQSPKPGTLEDFGIRNPDEGTVVVKIYGSAWISPKPHWGGHLRVEAIKEKGGKK